MNKLLPFAHQLVGLLLLSAIFCMPAFPAPVFQAEANGVRITLFDEPCELKTVANLPLKATWNEGGKSFSGCWGPRPQEGIVLAYFSDLTVVAIPIPLCTRAQGT